MEERVCVTGGRQSKSSFFCSGDKARKQKGGSHGMPAFILPQLSPALTAFSSLLNPP